jgi:ATP-binding cassette subfamily B protein
MPSADTTSSPAAVAKRAVRQMRPYWGLVSCIVLLDLISIPLALLLPLPLKIAVDTLTGSRSSRWLCAWLLPDRWLKWDMTPLIFAAVLLLAVYLLQHAVGFCDWLLRTYTGEKLVLSFRSQLFAHVQRLSFSFHDRKGSSDSAYRIQYDAPAVRDLLMNGILPLVNAVLTLVGMIYITVRIDWQIAAVSLAVAPVLFLLSRKYSKRVRTEWAELRERDSVAMGVIQETLNSVRVVKAFGQEDREHGRFLEHSGKYVRGQMRLSVLQSSFYVLVGMTVAVASTAALFLGARHVRAGALSIGSLLLLMSYVAKLYEPLSTVSGKLVESQSAMVSLGRAFSLLDEMPDVVEIPNAQPARDIRGAISFRNVSFQYDDSKLVLNGISFALTPGTHVGITGASGAGKSTILSLLTRFYDPIEGAILLDGVDLRHYKIQSLRNQFAIVLQEPVLFSTTIAENIAYAKPDATLDEIMQAAKAARAHDFITDLPEGYDTQVGQRGATLSGGERQRISLARAFLKNAPILIMDEPTSALDSYTEAEVVNATQDLMRGRTTFIIAHRTSTLDHCHFVFHLESGQLKVAADRRPVSYPAFVHEGAAAIEPALIRPHDMARAHAAILAE